MSPPLKEELVLTLFDLKRFVRSHCAAVLKLSLILGACSVLFFLPQSLHYRYESTLRTLGQSSSSSLKMQELLPQLTGAPSAEATIAILQSKRIMTQVIEELGLQAECFADSWIARIGHRIKERFLFEIGERSSSREKFSFHHVVFSEHEPLKLLLRFHPNGDYELCDLRQKPIGRTKIDSPIHAPWGQLTLSHLPEKALEGTFYQIKLFPLEKTLTAWRRKLKAFPSKLDRNVVQLALVHADYGLGAQFLNTWMKICEQFSKKEQEEIYQAQIQSLEQQSEEWISSYNETLFHHSQYLEKNLNESGGIGYLEEVEALSGPKNSYLSQLMDVDLKLKRLVNERGIEAKKKELIHHLTGYKKVESLTIPLLKIEKIEEFPDLNLSLASELLIDYNKQKNLFQSQVTELTFLRNQIEDPYFEITSIGGVFEDHVTKELVSRASQIALQLQDKGNRSAREQERLLEEIASQKSFLSQYLFQLIELKTLKVELLKDKISSLNIDLEKLLKAEQSLLKRKLEDVKGSMKGLPSKWYQESLLTLKKEQVTSMLKGMEQLISSLQLGKNSMRGGMKTLDLATLPDQPSDLRLWLISLTTLLISFAGLYGFFFLRTLYKGFPVSGPMLKAWGFPVISEPREKTLLRRLVDFTLDSPHSVVLSIGGSYFLGLAKLLADRGYKTLVVNGVSTQHENTSIHKSDSGHDCVNLDIDSLCSLHFHKTLTEWKATYDCILLQADEEGSSLLKIADRVVIPVQNERKEMLFPYFEWTEQQQENKILFIDVEANE